MSNLDAFGYALIVFLLSVSQANAATQQIQLSGNALADETNPLEWALRAFLGVTPATFVSSEDTAEYSYQSSDPDAGDYFEVDEVQFESGGSLANSAQFSTSLLSTTAALETVAPFGSLLIGVQNDIKFEDGTLFGDTVSFSFSSGTIVVDGNLIRQLSISLIDTSGTLVNSRELDEIVGLDLADTTSATYNILTNAFISNGTLAVYSVTAVPVPAAAWLFPSGLMAGVGWIRRRRRH